MKKKTDILDYFSPDARDERRAERVKTASKVSGTFNKLSERYTASHKLTTQNAGLSAVAMVRGIISHYRMPSEPKLGYSGLRNIRTAANSSKVTDGVVVVTASVRTPTNVYINFDVPIEIRNGELLEPSVIVHNGAPRVIAQSTFDEITTRHTAHEIMPVREMYSKPLDKKVSDHLYSNRVQMTRKMPGMFSVKANRDAIRRAISLGADVEVTLVKTASKCIGDGPSGDGDCPNQADPEFKDGLCAECAEDMANTHEPEDLIVPGLDNEDGDTDEILKLLGLDTSGLDKAMDGVMQEPSGDIVKKKYMASTKEATPRPVVPKPKPIKPPKIDPPKTNITPNPAPKVEAPKPYKPPKVETPKAPKPPNMRDKPDRNRPCKKCGFAPCKCPNKRKKKADSLSNAFAAAAKSVLNHDIKFVRDAQAEVISFDKLREMEQSRRVKHDIGGGQTVYVDPKTGNAWDSQFGGKRVMLDVGDGKFNEKPVDITDVDPGDIIMPGGSNEDPSFDRMTEHVKVDKPMSRHPTARIAKESKDDSEVNNKSKDNSKPKKDKPASSGDIKKQLNNYINELVDSGVKDIDIKIMLTGDPVTGKKPMFDKAGPDVIGEMMEKLFGDKESSFIKTGPEKKKADKSKHTCVCDCGCGTPVKNQDEKCLDCKRNFCK